MTHVDVQPISGGHRSEGFREKSNKLLRYKKLPVGLSGFCTELFNCVNYFNRA